jgi:hypothetical protein
MEKAEIKQQALIFVKARNNLLAVIVLTVVNIILSAFNASVSFPFSATIPQFVFEVGKSLESEMENNLFMTVGLVIAFIIIMIYFVFWILSKRKRVFILVALIFFIVDCLLLLYLISSMEFDASFFIDIAFHCWILYYLINGVRAWFKMRKVDTDVFNNIMQEIKDNKESSAKTPVSEESNEESDEEKTEDDNSTNQ